jgi:hypothetical protein
MARQPGRPLTIREWMARIVALALILSLFHVRTTGDAWLIASLAAVLPILHMLDIVADLLVGTLCPGCGHRKLRRLNRARSHARCASCGARFKRSSFLGAWCDASGPQDDHVFRGKSRRWSWIGYTIPHDDDQSTTGVLLRNRRERNRNPS